MTEKQRERLLEILASRHRDVWALAYWALQVGGPMGEAHFKDGSYKRLKAALDEVKDDGEFTVIEVPTVDYLRQLRPAAEAVPPALLERIQISIEAAKVLYRRVGDRRERHELIAQLAADGPITVEAVEATVEQTGFEAKDRSDSDSAGPEDPYSVAEPLQRAVTALSLAVTRSKSFGFRGAPMAEIAKTLDAITEHVSTLNARLSDELEGIGR